MVLGIHDLDVWSVVQKLRERCISFLLRTSTCCPECPCEKREVKQQAWLGHKGTVLERHARRLQHCVRAPVRARAAQRVLDAVTVRGGRVPQGGAELRVRPRGDISGHCKGYFG